MALAERVWTVRDVLDWTRERFERAGLANPRLDADVLLAATLGCERIALYTGWDKPLAAAERERYREAVQRRLVGEPVAYITGVKEFWSLALRVDRRVLVPRPDTETLVEAALRVLPEEREARACDVGTGSGAIALALLSERPLLRVVATDASAEALEVAGLNARDVAGVEAAARLELRQGDLFSAVAADERFDAIVSNPPYVRSEDIAGLMRDVRDFEPRAALDGGADGLDVVRRLVAEAPAHLAPGGVLLVELGAGQWPAVERLVAAATAAGAWARAAAVKDPAGIDRVAVLEAPGGDGGRATAAAAAPAATTASLA